MKKNSKKILILLLDVLLANFAFVMAMLIRFDFDVESGQFDAALAQYASCIPHITICMLISVILFGLLNSIWTMDALNEIVRIFVSTLVGELFSRMAIAISGGDLTLSIHLISGLIFATVLIASRTIIRFVAELSNDVSVQDAGPEKYSILLKSMDFAEIFDPKAVDYQVRKLRPIMEDKVVMIVGAGGELSSQLARQLSHTKPRRLILLDMAEAGISEATKDIKKAYPEIDIKALICDASNTTELGRLVKTYTPHIIINMALSGDESIVASDFENAMNRDVTSAQNLAQLAKDISAKLFLVVEDREGKVGEIRDAVKAIEGQSIIKYECAIDSKHSYASLLKEALVDGQAIFSEEPERKVPSLSIEHSAQLIAAKIVKGDTSETSIEQRYLKEEEIVLELASRVGYEDPKYKKEARADRLSYYKPKISIKKKEK